MGMIPRFLERFAIDFFLVAMPYMLLEQAGLEELEMCGEHGVSVVIGAPYASGILVLGPQPRALYNYRPARPEIIEKAERIAAVCRRHDVPLAAAALQFPLGHPSVASVIPGPRATEEVRKNLAWMRHDIPDALWAELKDEALIRAEAPTPRLRR
jgi:D-threo-aldose 1-dehydrogenase